MGTSERQKLLFEFLTNCECDRRTFTKEQAVEATGLSPASVGAYISKRLRGRWITQTDDGHYEVSGIKDVTLREFLDVMSQNNANVFRTREQWSARLRELLALGRSHGFPVRTLTLQALEELPDPRTRGT